MIRFIYGVIAGFFSMIMGLVMMVVSWSITSNVRSNLIDIKPTSYVNKLEKKCHQIPVKTAENFCYKATEVAKRIVP